MLLPMLLTSYPNTLPTRSEPGFAPWTPLASETVSHRKEDGCPGIRSPMVILVRVGCHSAGCHCLTTSPLLFEDRFDLCQVRRRQLHGGGRRLLTHVLRRPEIRRWRLSPCLKKDPRKRHEQWRCPVAPRSVSTRPRPPRWPPASEDGTAARTLAGRACRFANRPRQSSFGA